MSNGVHDNRRVCDRARGGCGLMHWRDSDLCWACCERQLRAVELDRPNMPGPGGERIGGLGAEEFGRGLDKRWCGRDVADDEDQTAGTEARS